MTPLVEIFFFPTAPEISAGDEEEKLLWVPLYFPGNGARNPWRVSASFRGVGKPQEEGGDVDSNKFSPQLWNHGLIDQ